MMHRSRALRAHVALALTALVTTASLVACKDEAKPDPSKTSPSASSSAATLTTPTASAKASASAEPSKPPPPCTIESTATIDKGARGDTGLTVVMLPGNQAAIGYATGEQPKVVVIDTTGKAQHVDVDWGHVRDQEKKKDDKMVRAIHRVTPLGYKGGKMRAGMDVIDTSKEKNAARYLRCGPADLEPIVADDSPLNFFEPTEEMVAAFPAETSDVRDCRTFSNGEISWVVATDVRRDGTGEQPRSEIHVARRRSAGQGHHQRSEHRQARREAEQGQKIRHARSLHHAGQRERRQRRLHDARARRRGPRVRASQRQVRASFASHVHRIQQVLDAAHQYHRKVAFVGRSMVRNMGIENGRTSR